MWQANTGNLSAEEVEKELLIPAIPKQQELTLGVMVNIYNSRIWESE